MQQTSPDKLDRLQYASAGFTTRVLDGYGLRYHLLARHPRPQIQFLYIDPVLVHRLVSLLHASFRPHLAMMPLRFAITSPPSVCEENFHLQAVKHARRSNKKPIRCGWACETYRERLRKSRNAPPHTSARKADNNRCSRWRDCSLMRQTTGIKSGMSSCG
jgi:hypothetical protein